MANSSNTVDALAPVFREFGAAVFICQSFESSLLLLLALMSHEQAGQEPGAFQAGWDFHSKKTLGQLLSALRARIEVPDDVDRFLSDGIDFRNTLIHGFMTKNAMRLADPGGRAEIQRELVELKREVKQRDILINKFVDVLLEKQGSSNAQLRASADRLWEFLNPQDNEDPSH